MGAVTVRPCAQCGTPFVPALRSPNAQMCSKRCRNRAKYLRGNGANRQRRTGPQPRAYKPRPRTPERIAYEREYNRRPEVMARQRERGREGYVPTPRARKVRYPVPETSPAPYTGHRWLEAAREAVSPAQTEFGWELYDRYNDEMGEAVLALLEGGDPKAAVKEFRKREFVPRHLTTHFSDFAAKEEEWKLERVDALKVESAEDEVMAQETILSVYRKPAVPSHYGAGHGLMGTPKQQAPAQRRQRVA